MKCFVINLDRDKDRLSKFDNEWKRAKIPFKYERVRAVDGSLLDNINNINILYSINIIINPTTLTSCKFIFIC